MGCSGKSQQHRLLPPSFPPASSLSQLPILLPPFPSISLFSLSPPFPFLQTRSVFPCFPVEFALFQPCFYAPRSSPQNPHINNHGHERRPLRVTSPSSKSHRISIGGGTYISSSPCSIRGTVAATAFLRYFPTTYIRRENQATVTARIVMISLIPGDLSLSSQ